MKRFLPILLWCSYYMSVSAQTGFVYGYDSNGNVVSRTKVSVSTPQHGQDELSGDILKDVIVEKQEGTDQYKVSVVGNKKAGSFKLNGRLIGNNKYHHIYTSYLQVVDGRFVFTEMDSTKVSNGMFSFSGGMTTSITLVKLWYDIKRLPLIFCVEPSEMEIVINIMQPYLFTVSGGRFDDEQMKFRRLMLDRDSLEYVSREKEIVMEQHTEKAEDIAAYERAYLQLDKIRWLRHDTLSRQRKERLVSFLKQKPLSHIAPFVALSVLEIDPFSYSYVKQLLCTYIKTGDMAIPLKNAILQAQNIKNCLENPIGVTAPDFKGKTINGETFIMSKNRKNYMLLYMWATWLERPADICDINNIKSLSSIFGNNLLEIVGVSIDDDKDKLQIFIKNNKIPGVHIFDRNWDYTDCKETLRICSIYPCSQIPCYFLINKEGKIDGFWRHIDDMVYKYIKDRIQFDM